MLKESLKLKADKIEIIETRNYADEMIAVDHKDWMEHFKLLKTELGHFRTEYD